MPILSDDEFGVAPPTTPRLLTDEEFGATPAPTVLSDEEFGAAPAPINPITGTPDTSPEFAALVARKKANAEKATNSPVPRLFNWANRPLLPKENPETALVRNARQFALANEVSPPAAQEEMAAAMPSGSKQEKMVAGATEAVEDTARFFTSPLGIATLAMGGLPKLAQRAIALAFATQMATQTPEIARQLGDEIGKPEKDRDYQKIANLTTSGLLTTGFTVSGALHGLKPGEVIDINAEVKPAAEAKPVAENDMVEAKPELTPDALADLQLSMRQNQVKPPVRMPGREMLEELHQNNANVAAPPASEPKTGTIVPEQPLTEPLKSEKTGAGAAAETITGQNEQPGSEAPTAATSAVEPMPAEGEKPPRPPQSSKSGKNPFWLRPRSDGVPDILDSIQELGGIRPPGEYSGGEYDGYREAMTGPARVLIRKGAAHGPDTIVGELRSVDAPGANRIETADDLWDAITAARKAREKLRTIEKGQREESKQAEQFQLRAIDGTRPKKEAGTFTPVPVGKMLEGDVFKVQNNSFTVRHLEFDNEGSLVFVEVKDGPKFGVQTVDGQEFIHVDKGSFEPGPNHDDYVPAELSPAVKSPVPSNKDIGGSTSGPAMELKEEPTPENLDKNALHFYGKRHAELSPEDQAEIRRAAETESIPRRQQPGRAERREPVNPGGEPEAKTATPRAAGALQSAGTEADPIQAQLNFLQEERAKLERQSAGDAVRTDAVGTYPSDRLGVGRLAQIRYLDGQIDILRQIASADPELKAKWFRKFLEGDAPDQVERALDRLIAATDPLRPLKQGRLLEGSLQLPVWLTKAVFHNALKIVRTAYSGSKRLAESIQEGVAWLRAQNLKGFDQDEAHVALLKAMQEGESAETGAKAKSLEEITRRREEIAKRLDEISATKLQPGTGLPAELRSERFALVKESRALERERLSNPDYVRDVYRRMEKLSTDLQHANKAGNGAHAQQLADELTSIMDSELSRIPEDLKKRIYDELVAKGEIMKSQMREMPAGRTLDSLTAWLKANGADSPGIPIRERFNLARRLTDDFNRGKDALTNAFGRARASWEAFKAQYKAPPIDDDFRGLMKNWFFEKQWTGLEIHKWLQEIRDAIPQKLRRQAVAIYLDAGGDENLLRSQADMVPERWREVWKTALNLTPKEKAFARRIQLDFEQKLSDGQGLGLLDRGRADYGVPQQWKVKPKYEGEYDPADPQWKKPRTPRRPGAKLDPRDPFFALQRSVPTYFDGIMAEGVPASLDIGDLVGLYNSEFHNSLADRGVIKSLKDAKAPDGSPIVTISGAARIEPREAGARTYFVDSNWRPKDAVTADGRPYRTIDHWALRDWKFASATEEGNPVIVHGDFLVHPDYYRYLKNELGKSWLRDPEGGGKYFNWLLDSAAFLKASKFASATFHMATLAEHSAFHAFAGKPNAERLSLLWPSTRGVELDPIKNPELAQLMRHGTELGFGSQRELFEEGLSSHGGIWGKVPGLGDAMTKMSDFLFKRYMPALKVKTALAMLHANETRYAGKLTPEQIYELTSNQANAAFGAQNWKLLGTNKTMLDVNRLLLTAPDFLLSRAKVVAQAFKPYNAEQRNFLLAQAAIIYVAARVLNELLDGDPHWEPANALRVVYKGRAYSGRFLVNDMANLVQDTPSFMAGRLGPLPRSGYEAVTGRDMRTGARKETIIPTDNAAFRSTQILLQDFGQWLVPVGLEGFAPGAAGREQTGPGQVALALAGVGSRKYTAETQMYEAATRFNRNSADAKTQLYQKTRDAEAIVQSQFRKLDDLLDAGDLEAARKEYEALKAEGHTDQGFLNHFAQRPFTGNAAREAAFKESLTPAELKVYQQALQDRAKRRENFGKMLQGEPLDAAR